MEGWEQSKQNKEGVPKRALQAGSAGSTLVASAMAQGVNWLTPTAAFPSSETM
jgi:nicotinamide mononucleotide (NMN) deamidase PncC